MPDVDSPEPQSTSPTDALAAVRGSVVYRERVALPPEAEVRVWLLDVSRQDVAATLVAEHAQRAAGRQVPIPFSIAYWPGAIDERFTYAVRVEIRIDGEVRFRSTTTTPVITRGSPVEAVVVSVTAPRGIE